MCHSQMRYRQDIDVFVTQCTIRNLLRLLAQVEIQLQKNPKFTTRNQMALNNKSQSNQSEVIVELFEYEQTKPKGYHEQLQLPFASTQHSSYIISV